MRIFKVAALQLDHGDHFWIRKYVFPGSAVVQVVEAFQALLPAKPKFQPLLLYARAPPTAPKPGVPTLILTLTYYGPSHEAAAVIEPLIAPELASGAILSETGGLPFTSMFDAVKMLDAHGDFKSQHTVRAHTISTSTCLSAFDRWKRLGDEVPDARATVLVLSGYDPSAAIANGVGNARPFFIARDRPMIAITLPWYKRRETGPAVEKYITDVTAILRADDEAKGLPGVTLAANLRNGDPSHLELAYTKEMLREIRRVHAKWNPDSVLYSVLDDLSW
jgi:hypothetical protein